MRFPFSAGRRRLTFGAGAAALLGGPRAMAAGAALPSNGPDGGAAPAAPLDAAPQAALGTGAWAHAWAAFGEPKYPRGYDHFEWVEPTAPKGGTLYLSNPDRRTSFDKYNPFTIRGSAPAGVSIFMFESLALPSADEPSTIYGLLAESIRVAPDLSSVAFRLHPQARFLDGDRVLAADVKHSFDLLTSKYAAPGLQIAFGGVRAVTIEDERTIRFELKDHTIDNVGTVAGLPVFSRKWGAGPDGKVKRFDEIVTEFPITTGPYRIGRAESGRRIEFERRDDYWAKDLGARKGQYNFDRIVYRYYKDGAVSMEAFKAGEFDIIQEYSARRWVRQHEGRKWREGLIRKEVFETGMGQGMQAYLMNLRRPIWRDRRVRESLDLAYDFEWINRYHVYKRTNSLFANSPFAARGLPGPGELKLLEPWREQLPPAVFGPPYQPPRTDESKYGVRDNLRRARDLLAAAGFTLGADGVLKNAEGLRLEFEYMSPEDGADRTTVVWRKNLEKLGIRMRLRRVDFALYRKRLEVYDYDFIAIAGGDFTLPSPIDYITSLGSKAADEPGGNNFRGVKSPAVDALLQAMDRARTLEALQDACRALDRVVTHEHWQVPDLYSSSFRASYWDRFAKPARKPLYYAIDTVSSLPDWPITTWWVKPGSVR
jgi:peptide/nickel transport system substrate-binding protein/microcin C transport system substrate-binding protein